MRKQRRCKIISFCGSARTKAHAPAINTALQADEPLCRKTERFLKSIWEEIPRSRLLDHIDRCGAQGKLGEELRPGEERTHGSGGNVLLWNNEGIARVKAQLIES